MVIVTLALSLCVGKLHEFKKIARQFCELWTKYLRAPSPRFEGSVFNCFEDVGDIRCFQIDYHRMWGTEHVSSPPPSLVATPGQFQYKRDPVSQKKLNMQTSTHLDYHCNVVTSAAEPDQ